MKVTLIKDWKHPHGKLKKKGAVLEVTTGLKKELIEGGYIDGPKKEKKESLKFKNNK